MVKSSTGEKLNIKTKEIELPNLELSLPLLRNSPHVQLTYLDMMDQV